jgi:hypothetical protein
MNCLVCGYDLESYFIKDFNGEYSLDKVHYEKCNQCGLVVARELLEMPLKQWEELNNLFHSSFFGKPEFDLDPNWNKRIDRQVADLIELSVLGIVDTSFCLDYACGDGRLIERFNDSYDYCVGFDKYTEFQDNCGFLNKKFKLVINTSFFEHVRNRDWLDEVNNLVSDSGVLALHTLVCEEVPRDPSWFYLVPVHSVVYTNQAMRILFDQWKYSCCLYNIDSRMWFWFKKSITQKYIPPRFLYENGFIDFQEIK